MCLRALFLSSLVCVRHDNMCFLFVHSHPTRWRHGQVREVHEDGPAQARVRASPHLARRCACAWGSTSAPRRVRIYYSRARPSSTPCADTTTKIAPGVVPSLSVPLSSLPTNVPTPLSDARARRPSRHRSCAHCTATRADDISDARSSHARSDTPMPTPVLTPSRAAAPLRHIFVRRATAAHHDGNAPRYATYLLSAPRESGSVCPVKRAPPAEGQWTEQVIADSTA